MPKIKEKEGWLKVKRPHIITARAGKTLSVNIPRDIGTALGWKIGDVVASAKIYGDTWLVWKETKEPELLLIAKPKIAPSFDPIEFGIEKQEEYLKGGKAKGDLFRSILSKYILGAESIEISSTELLPNFQKKLDERLEKALRVSPPSFEKREGKEIISFTVLPPPNAFQTLDNMYKEARESVSEVIELISQGTFDRDTFDKCKTTVEICEHNCDLRQRMLLRNLEINKIDEMDNLPYIAIIVKYLEQISDHLLDIIRHIERLEFETPEIVKEYALEFKEKILDMGYFIDPTERDYTAFFLNDAITECIRIEVEEGRKALEKLEESNLKGKRIVNSCFLVARISRICRGLHNIAEVKYDWQGSSYTQKSNV